MWITQPGLREIIKDKNGKEWSFAYWQDFISGVMIQRIYFWDKEKNVTGLMEFKGNNILHLSRWKARVLKIVKNKDYRDRFLCSLEFPIDNSKI
jgi:hypothetical protein